MKLICPFGTGQTLSSLPLSPSQESLQSSYSKSPFWSDAQISEATQISRYNLLYILLIEHQFDTYLKNKFIRLRISSLIAISGDDEGIIWPEYK
jgi:hypothetical protein